MIVAPPEAIRFEGKEEEKNYNAPRSKKRKQEEDHLAAAAVLASSGGGGEGIQKCSSIIIDEQQNMSKRAKKLDAAKLKKPWEPSLDPLERENQWDVLEDLLEDTRFELEEAKRMESQRVSKLDSLSHRLDNYYSCHARIEN
mmetsp:Transcript_4891/g.6451  ORF Transcript_4891/g.6451 Transcript_4891/m.6451 type:complete len:142 (+) Transcript_4891:3-428(+)